MSAWQPTDQGLSEILQLLREAVNPTSGQNVQAKLEYFNNVPDFNNYLVYVLTKMPQEPQYNRAVAGLTLKNNIRSYYPSFPAPVADYIKECCLQHLGDEEIGKTVSLVIAAIMARGQVQNWPHGLQVLLEKLDDPSPVMVDHALGTLQKVCEDCSRDLDTSIGGVQPLEFMIPKFINFFDHPNAQLRLAAIRCTQQFIASRSEPLMRRMNEFLSALFNRATDDSVEVRRAVCQALVNILEVCPENLLPHMPNLVEYMLYCTMSDDEDLALEACEFWLVFAEQDSLRDQFQGYLPKVIPVLLKCMVYSETDLLIMGGDDDDAHVADSEQDIKPRFHKANVVEVERADKNDLEEGGAQKKKNGLLDGDNADDDEDEDDDDYDLDDDDDMYGEWNLRKCSAAALDIICTAFEGEAIQLLMPLLKTELESSDWLHRECGILALGAAAEGGLHEIAPHLPELVPYLLTNLNDSKPLVRSITCWTLGRFAQWIIEASQQSPEARKHYLETLVQQMLQRILDNNKRVQEAACSSFSLLEEEATTDMIPYLQPILATLSTAFEKYQRHNVLLLYDTLGTLADAVGEALGAPQYIDMVMKPLITKWQETPDDNTDLFPLLECLSSVTTALGKNFKPFAEPIYVRCVNLVCKTLEECQLAAHNPAMEEPDKDFMIVALDLLSGIVQALNTDAEPLVANTQPPVVQFLSMCINDEVAEVRQSSYALLGDLAISCFEHIRAVVPQFMPLILQQIDPQAESPSVCNNATWAAGEITIKLGNEIQPYVEPLLQRLFPLMVNQSIQRTLLENVAITIGRLGLICPTMVAPHLENFVHPWLVSLSPVRDNEEKASAFSGLCEMIKTNPEGALKVFPLLCTAIANYHIVPQPLQEAFGNILSGYKNMFGEQQWQQGVASLPQETKTTLQERYHI
ncbi:armadillo-type protein [Halteromyces radiatus]|uniref:armadillo-type protein n=1 Tax=Halteromyces radiatus TaxID=101107 RepID=UPI00221E6F79|nr:armadillo-type protein [Halteromyces radiatus]KAI8092910.1 armadillo-type protein [Halteromyces radiatus]